MRVVKRVPWVACFVASAWLIPSTRAAAQDKAGWGGEEAAEKSDDEPSPEAPEVAAEPSPAAAESNAEPAAPDGTLDAPNDSAEPSNTKPAPRALGLRYRGIIIPQAVLNWFVDGGETVYVNAIGPELAVRNDNVEYIFSAWVAFYGMNPVAIKGSSDAEEAWEIVESDIKSVYLTVDYLWHSSLATGLELSYGGGAGIGFLFGDLNRTQATLPAGSSPGDADAYVPCDGVNAPSRDYCDDINQHYDGYGEPNWFHGGTKPALFPWLAAQAGLRYQPHEKVVMRLDLGLGSSGLFFGLGADYAL